MYFIYVLHNPATNRYYVGFTSDLKNRLKIHQNGKVKSTKSNKNYILKWYCAFQTKNQAIEFEKYLKTGSGTAFMRKRFFKSQTVAIKKDNEAGNISLYEALAK